MRMASKRLDLRMQALRSLWRILSVPSEEESSYLEDTSSALPASVVNVPAASKDLSLDALLDRAKTWSLYNRRKARYRMV
jgi:hypothetical protein